MRFLFTTELQKYDFISNISIIVESHKLTKGVDYFVDVKKIEEGEDFIEFNLSFVKPIGIVHFTF